MTWYVLGWVTPLKLPLCWSPAMALPPEGSQPTLVQRPRTRPEAAWACAHVARPYLGKLPELTYSLNLAQSLASSRLL